MAMPALLDSKFSHHEPCPSCGSRDNVGVWDDGHKYCFGCGWHDLPGKESRRFKQQLSHSAPQAWAFPEKQKRLSLPNDSSMLFPTRVKDWLEKYGLTFQEQMKHNLRWSQNKQCLIFPVYGPAGELLMWQGRYFGDNLEHPKYLTYGKPQEVLDLIEPTSYPHVVLVEDKISQIKVGRTYNAMCLYGSQISMTSISRLANLFQVLTIWLDYDKIDQAYKYQASYGHFFDEVNVVNSAGDPKDYTDVEIREKIQNAS